MRRQAALLHHGFEALRFLAVGGANFVLTLVVFYAVLRDLRAHHLVALSCAWAVGIVFSYALNFTWVFKPEDRLRFRSRFAKFFGASLASILLNMLALHALVAAGGIDPFLAQCALIPLVVAFNYATSKFWSLRADQPSRTPTNGDRGRSIDLPCRRGKNPSGRLAAHLGPPMDFEVIDGIRCYAPEIARQEDGYPSLGFDVTDEVESASFWVRARNRMLLDLFRRHANPGRRTKVLEIGCGTGNFLGELARSGNYDIIGSEAYLAGLRYARMRRPDIEFIQLDALRMPFEHEFDVVGAFDVIEHIDDDAGVLTNMRKALKPGGIAVISVPQHRFLWSELDELVHHKRRYSRAELLDKLRTAGLQVEFRTSFVFALFPLMLAKRLAGRSRGAAQRQAFESHVKLHPLLNSTFDAFMRIDEALIRWGVALPFGGTLVVVARAPVVDSDAPVHGGHAASGPGSP